MRRDSKDVNPFYNRVDHICRSKGMSHSGLAEACGVGAVTFSRYLRLERTCSVLVFALMCERLGVDMNSMIRTYVYAYARKEHNGDE